MERRIFLYEWIGCADPAAQMVYLEEVTLHARGRLGTRLYYIGTALCNGASGGDLSVLG